MKNRNVIYIRVLLVVLSIVIFLAFTGRSPKQARRDTWLPSSFNPVGAGNMALFQTLQDLRWPVERWREPFGRLRALGTGNTLIITRSPLGATVLYSEQEIDLLEQWVARGNTLLLLGDLSDWDDTRNLLWEFGFTPEQKGDSVSRFLEPFAQNNEQTLELQPGPDSGQSGALVIPMTNSLSAELPKGAATLWENRGLPYVIVAPHGAGRVILGASDRLLSNTYLQRGENLALVLRLLAPDGATPHRLLFEESHHGFSAIYAIVHLLDHPGVRFAGMLALLGALAFLGSSLVRFGPVIPLTRETGRSTLEFVDSIAELYLRADVRNDTIHYLFHETHQRVLQRLHLPPTASHDLIGSRLEQAQPQLPKWKKLAQRFDSHDYIQGLPPTGWLRVAKELVEIKTAMA